MAFRVKYSPLATQYHIFMCFYEAVFFIYWYNFVFEILENSPLCGESWDNFNTKDYII